jgi:hypothetical protein
MINLLKLLFLVFLAAFAFVDQQILIQKNTEIVCKTRGKVCTSSMISNGVCESACSGKDCDDADYEDCN